MSEYMDRVGCPIDNSPAWDLYEKCYNKHYPNVDSPDMIPKILHQVWLGSTFPWKYERLRDTWLDLHPDWEYRLWTDTDAEKFDMVNRTAFDTITNLGAKSDIFRYEILYKHGGIYFDTDFECVKPFDDLLYLDFFIGNGWNADPSVYNGLIGCKPGNEYLKSIMYGVKAKPIKPYYRLDKIMEYAGNDYITNLMYDYLQETSDKAVVFPRDFFYPMPNTIREEVRLDCDASRDIVMTYKKECTYAIHMWYVSWVNMNNFDVEPVRYRVKCLCGHVMNMGMDYVEECSKCKDRYRIMKTSKKSRPTLYAQRLDKRYGRYGNWNAESNFC